jgi:hypothetical protein
VVRQLGERGTVSLQGLAFQRLYEFRLDEGSVYGVGAEATVRFADRMRAFAAATIYRHAQAGPNAGMDWNQRRGTLRLEWTLGPEPGDAVPTGGAR